MMREGAADSLVSRAHAAAAGAVWTEACELFTDADADGLLTIEDLPVFATAAYAAGDLQLTVATWERAHADLLRAGQSVMAAGAAVRVAMHLLFDTALLAPVRGWLGRAEALLEGQQPAAAPAWLPGVPPQ